MLKLEPADVFYLACSEAFRDGELEADEIAVLLQLRRTFGIEREAAQQLIDKARRDADRARSEVEVPVASMQPHDLYAQACRMAWIDGHLEPDEESLLASLADLLGIDPEEAAGIAREAREALSDE